MTSFEDLFARALELPTGEREALLASAELDARNRPVLRRLLARHEALARSDAQGPGFLAGLDLDRAAELIGALAPADPPRIGRYDIIRRLGTGATGVVYLARDPTLEREVAVKLLAGWLSRDPMAVHRFTEEARLASALDHPRVATVYEIGRTDDDRLFIAMAYHEGESLRSRLARGALPLEDAVRIADQVAEGLALAHARGIVHRDVKPENILLTARGVTILDFGVAKIMSGSPKTSGGRVGTVAYMSPEQTSGDPVDPRSDLWSLGVVLYEMLAGERPFRADGAAAVVHAIRHGLPPPVTALRPDVPAALTRLLTRCLEKDPERRIASADLLRSALGARPRRPATTVLAGVGLLAALVAGVTLLRHPARAALDPHLLAVAPFDVLDADPGVWREGLVDVLSANLDGAGPLRAVPPSAVLRRWQGRADRPTASSVAGGLGAGLVIYGRMLGAGADSVRLTASLVDVVRGAALGEFEFRGPSDRVDRLADSLAVGVLAELNRDRRLGAERLNSLGSESPAALKAFLQGERHFRRMSLDSAAQFYRRAVQEDSGFALALNRLGLTLGWSGQSGAAEFLRAGSLNRGLARRESLLVAADSLLAVDPSDNAFTGDTLSRSRFRRGISTLELATALYPDDAGAWYRLGEARAHSGTFAGGSNRETLLAFERVAALDSSYGPAHLHLLELTLAVHGIEAGRRLVLRLVRRNPGGAFAGMFRLTGLLLDREMAEARETESLLDTLPGAQLLSTVLGPLTHAPDSAESIVRAARAYVRRELDGGFGPFTLPLILAFRGHTREAFQSIAPRILGRDAVPSMGGAIFSELALLGIVAPDTAAAVFAGWLDRLERDVVHRPMPMATLTMATLAVAWWCREGDTLSLKRVAVAADAVLRRGTAEPTDTHRVRYVGDVAQAYLTLARQDSALALTRFQALPPWPLPPWPAPLSVRIPLITAQLLAAAGRAPEAALILDADPTLVHPRFPVHVLWVLERGRIRERLGDRDEALRAYSYVAEVWRHADPELQPIVREARAALVRLGP